MPREICWTCNLNSVVSDFFFPGDDEPSWTFHDAEMVDITNCICDLFDSHENNIQYLITVFEIVDTDNYHLHCHVTLKESVVLDTFKTWVVDCGLPAPHVALSRDPIASIKYCKKDNLFLEFGSEVPDYRPKSVRAFEKIKIDDYVKTLRDDPCLLIGLNSTLLCHLLYQVLCWEDTPAHINYHNPNIEYSHWRHHNDHYGQYTSQIQLKRKINMKNYKIINT
jgi:hypothetical protein